jgi:general secretion pathway protein J
MNRRQRGFTLVEMLIALSISVLLVTLVYAALRTGMRSWEATQQQVARSDDQRIGWLFLERTLNQTRPVADPHSDQNTPLFEGHAEALRFVADMPSYLGLGGLYLVELLPESNADGDRLILRRTLMSRYRLQGPDAEDNPQQAVLAPHLGEVRFAYYGTDDNANEPGWRDQWLAQTSLPSLIRIDIRDADGRHWPSLIAHPFNSATLATETDDATGDQG